MLLIYYIIVYLFRWTALYMAGGQICSLMCGRSSIGDTLLLFAVMAVMWLLAKLYDFMLGHPQPPKFLNTRTKQIIAAAVTFCLGFISFIYM